MGRELKRSSVRTNNQYYMYTANAVAPDYQWEYEEKFQPVSQKQQEVKKKQKPKQHFLQALAPNLVMLMMIFGLGLATVGQYVYIQNISYNINQSKEELKVVTTENEKLKKQVAALGDLQAIEAYAMNNIGMVKATSNDMMFLAQEKTTVNYAEKTQETVVENGSVSAALTSLLGVVE